MSDGSTGMGKTRVTIKTHNKQAYIAMMRDMFAKKNGVFSFVVRCDSGRIVDYVNMENVKINNK